MKRTKIYLYAFKCTGRAKSLKTEKNTLK